MSKYEFTKDWFSVREVLWTSHFGRLAFRAVHALEIGSLEGRSAVWMLDHLLVHPESRLDCIDIFHNCEFESRFDRNIAASGAAHKVRKHRGFSWVHLRELPPNDFDLIYVDGSHHGQCVIEDAVLSFRLLKRNGYLVFDDYPWQKNEAHPVFPKDAIDAFKHLYQGQIELIDLGWQAIFRKLV